MACHSCSRSSPGSQHMSIPRPSVDPELAAPLAEMRRLVPTLNDEVVATARSFPTPPIDEMLEAKGVGQRDVVVAGPPGAPDVALSIFARTGETPTGVPCFYWI